MRIESGKLDRKLDIYRATTSREPGGQIIREWAKVGSTYAQRLELRTVDSTRAGQRDSYSIGRFLIRYRAGLTTADRVVVDGATFDILSVDEADRRATMVVTVEQATLDPIEVA